jgi:hypothetical protein
MKPVLDGLGWAASESAICCQFTTCGGAIDSTREVTGCGAAGIDLRCLILSRLSSLSLFWAEIVPIDAEVISKTIAKRKKYLFIFSCLYFKIQSVLTHRQKIGKSI